MFKGQRFVQDLKSRTSVKVDERIAYMVNPSDYATMNTAWLKWREVAKSLKVSPKATDKQKKDFARFKKQFDDAMFEVEDAIVSLGDMDSIADDSKNSGNDPSESNEAAVAGQEVEVDWDGPTVVKVLKVDGDKVTIQRKNREPGEDPTMTITKAEFADMVMGEALTGDKLLAEIEDILATKTAATIDGTLVDMQTAMIVSQVASGLSPENKTKFLSKGIVKAAEIAWKLVK